MEFLNVGDDVGQYVDLQNVPSADDLTVMFWMKARELHNASVIDRIPNDTSGAGWTVKIRTNDWKPPSPTATESRG